MSKMMVDVKVYIHSLTWLGAKEAYDFQPRLFAKGHKIPLLSGISERMSTSTSHSARNTIHKEHSKTVGSPG